VYIGPLHAAQDEKFLFQRARIGAIVSVGDFTPLWAHRGVEYLECIVRDRSNEDIRPAIEQCAKFIAEKRAAGVNVLVHCLGGRSRSVTIVTAYLMIQHNMSLALALSTVVRQRPIASPNLGFLRTLRTLED
jgi:protein-tyrosine phosphatase